MIRLLALCAAAAAAQDLSHEAAQAMRESRFGDAERIYRRILKDMPEDARMHMNLGLALLSGGKDDEAIPEFDRFLKAYPQPGPVHLMAGAARLKLGRACDAIGLLEKARKWQSSAQVLVELGDAYSGCKRPLDAAKSYKDAARLSPDDPRLARAAGRGFWQAHEYQDARSQFVAVEPRFAGDPEFLYEYGDTLARIDGAASGLPYLEKAVRAAPDLIAARGALGRALLEVHRAAESIPHLEAAAPTDPALLMPLSRAYRAVGRAEDAARAEAEYRKRLQN
jgi:predicted Zn-dependent protease